MKSCLSFALVAALGLVSLPSFAESAEDTEATAAAVTPVKATDGAKPTDATKAAKSKKTRKRHKKTTQVHGRGRTGVTQVKNVHKASQKDAPRDTLKDGKRTDVKRTHAKLPTLAAPAEVHPRVWIDHEHGEPASFADTPFWSQTHEDLAMTLGQAVRGGLRAVKSTTKSNDNKKAGAKREIEVGLEKPSVKANAKSDAKADVKADATLDSDAKVDAKLEKSEIGVNVKIDGKVDAKSEPKIDVKADVPVEEHAPEPKALPPTAKSAKSAKADEKNECPKVSTEVYRGPEVASFVFSRCDGDAHLGQRLAAILRPASGKLTDPKSKIGSTKVDARLVSRMAQMADHFARPGEPVRMAVIAGIRPSTQGSQHAHGRAIDLRIEGVPNEKLVDFCKTLSDTGCGYYPNTSFVHVDVREPGTGHIYWIDASGPGETPRYVTSWPEETN